MGRRFRLVSAAAAVAVLISQASAPASPPQDPPPAPVPAPVREKDPAKAPAERVLRLSLQEAVAMAMKGNLDLRADAFGPRVAEASLRESESLYDHLFTSRVSGGENRAPVASNQLGNGTEIFDEFLGYAAGVQRLLPTGGTLSLQATLDRTLTNSVYYQINPYYQSSLTLNLSQPLLRNAGRGVTESGIRYARDSRDAADLDLRSRTERLVLDVETTYWGLVQARGDVEARVKGVTVAEDLMRITEARLAAGAGTRVDVSQAAAGVALRRVDLLRSENSARSFEEDLLGLLMPRTPDSPSGEPTRVDPSDDPAASLPPLPTEPPDSAVARSLADRTDIRTQRVFVDQAENGVLVAESEAKVRLDLQAAYGYSGVEGHGDTSFTQSMATRNWPSWSVALVLEVPIGNRAGRARLERALLSRDQAGARVRALESNAAVRVRNARRDLESTREQIDAARKASRLSEEQLDAEKERLRNDKSTTFEVLRLESDLTDARRSEIRALTDFLIASARYEFELGRLLESRGLAPPK